MSCDAVLLADQGLVMVRGEPRLDAAAHDRLVVVRGDPGLHAAADHRLVVVRGQPGLDAGSVQQHDVSPFERRVWNHPSMRNRREDYSTNFRQWGPAQADLINA